MGLDNQQERLSAARLAMLFDCEGSLTLRVQRRSKKRPLDISPVGVFCNTNETLIEWAVQELTNLGVGCHVQSVDYTKYQGTFSKLPQKRVTIAGCRRVKRLLECIEEFLISKAKHAALLREYIESRGDGGPVYTERELQISNEIRSLSQKGKKARSLSSETIRLAPKG